MTKYPLKNLYLDPEALAILATLPARLKSEYVRLLIKADTQNANPERREFAKRELALFRDKIRMENRT